MCVVVVLVVRVRRGARQGHQLKMTVYPVVDNSKQASPQHRQQQLAEDSKTMTEIDSTAERSPDLIPEGE